MPSFLSRLNKLDKYPFFAIIFGLILATLLIEAVLQVADYSSYNKFYYDTQSGLLLYTPNTSYTVLSSCFENKVSINNIGFYGHDAVTTKAQNVYRIAIIGSSFVEGLQVPLKQHFATLLEQRLNNLSSAFRFEVIPFGFSGNGTYLDILYYKNYVTSFKPDLVLDLTTEYEVSRNAPSAVYPPRFDQQGNLILQLPIQASNPSIVFIKNIVRRSKLVMNLYNRCLIVLDRWKAFARSPHLFSEHAPEAAQHIISPVTTPDSSWKIEETLLSTFQDMVEKNGAKFLLVSWETPYSRADGQEHLKERLQTITSAHKIDYLNLVPAIIQHEQSENLEATWQCDGHWNQNGHAWAAEEIANYLQQSLTLLKQNPHS